MESPNVICAIGLAFYANKVQCWFCRATQETVRALGSGRETPPSTSSDVPAPADHGPHTDLPKHPSQYSAEGVGVGRTWQGDALNPFTWSFWAGGRDSLSQAVGGKMMGQWPSMPPRAMMRQALACSIWGFDSPPLV